MATARAPHQPARAEPAAQFLATTATRVRNTTRGPRLPLVNVGGARHDAAAAWARQRAHGSGLERAGVAAPVAWSPSSHVARGRFRCAASARRRLALAQPLRPPRCRYRSPDRDAIPRHAVAVSARTPRAPRVIRRPPGNRARLVADSGCRTVSRNLHSRAAFQCARPPRSQRAVMVLFGDRSRWRARLLRWRHRPPSGVRGNWRTVWSFRSRDATDRRV